MYHGIQISHPVYAGLFSNLTVAMTSSVLDVFVLPFVKSIFYDVLGTTSSAISLTYHCNCWQVLTILSYIYIVHPAVVDQYFPGTNAINLFAACREAAEVSVSLMQEWHSMIVH